MISEMKKDDRGQVKSVVYSGNECDFMIREYRTGISRCSDHIFIVMEIRVSPLVEISKGSIRTSGFEGVEYGVFPLIC